MNADERGLKTGKVTDRNRRLGLVSCAIFSMTQGQSLAEKTLIGRW
jgi:hypothetical protein